MSDSDKNKPSENDIESPNEGPTPDWMRLATSGSGSPSLTEENTPDWLKKIRSGKNVPKQEPAPEPKKAPPPAPKPSQEDPYAGMSDLERLLAEEGIELGSVAEERPEGSE